MPIAERRPRGGFIFPPDGGGGGGDTAGGLFTTHTSTNNVAPALCYYTVSQSVSFDSLFSKRPLRCQFCHSEGARIAAQGSIPFLILARRASYDTMHRASLLHSAIVFFSPKQSIKTLSVRLLAFSK